jgi:hypothetical protein
VKISVAVVIKGPAEETSTAHYLRPVIELWRVAGVYTEDSAG